MASDVVMPKMGYDMTEGTILRWIRQEGDAVARGDILGEIETGKVNIEIEAFDGGILRRILVPEGETVPVGTPIAVIGTADEVLPERPSPAAAEALGRANGMDQPAGADGRPQLDQPSPAPPSTAAAPADGPTPAVGSASPGGDVVRASPLARRLAAEHHVDLSLVAGSGPGGRVVRDDVLAAAEAPPLGMAARPLAAPPPPDGVRREPLSRMRRTIARRLTDSWTAAPHIFLTMPIVMDEALALREQMNAVLAATSGGKVSVNDLVVMATARALVRHPRMNASWVDGIRLLHDRVHIGVAVALEDGLVTVIVADADRKPAAVLAAELAAKAARAREGKLLPEDVAEASTFTVTNLGPYGVEHFTAIINPPEAAILAVGAATPTPVVDDGQVVVRTVMKVTLAADHRVVDGATAAEFLAEVRALLEHPLLMLL
jgi:pyruvate dehydrogenase E2 component (dihydrolipoamide acetyltransferase)